MCGVKTVTECHRVLEAFLAPKTGDFGSVMSLYLSFCLRQLCSPFFSFFWFVPGFVEVER